MSDEPRDRDDQAPASSDGSQGEDERGDDRYAHLRDFYEHFSAEREGAIRVGHRSVDAQLVRFEVLLDALDPVHHPTSVLDIGCGVGDLYGYLDETGRLGDYVGIDLLPDMIDEARRRYPEATFLVADIAALGQFSEGRDADGLPEALERRFGLVVASGTLNIAVDDHDRWVRDCIAAMWSRTELSLAVNFTSTRTHRFDVQARFDDDIRYLDPTAIDDFCQTLTPWVTLRQDYMSRDATVYLYRDYHRAAAAMRDRTWTQWSLSPDRACTLAAIFTERGQAADALGVLEAVDPTPEVLLALGLAHHALRDFGAARTAYRAALEADDSLDRARRALQWLDQHGL